MGFVALFIVCHLPRLFINIYELANLERIKECNDLKVIVMFAVSNFLLAVNSSVNVLVYAYRSKDYREVCKKLIVPLVSLLIQAHGLLEAAKDPAAEDLQESLKTSTSTERCINISLDIALTLACVVSEWFKILHMPFI